ncbi:MAG: hypothetical protein II575_13965 [Bacteroidales bacterium]|nr:hypothetical protein [Bacteroidales bacterium]MBQ2575315.1 hypothetical protein [Bacteroidales bacterium]
MKRFSVALMLCVISIMMISCSNNNPLNKTIDQPLTLEEVASVNDTIFSQIYDEMKDAFDNLPTEFKVNYIKITYSDVLNFAHKVTDCMENGKTLEDAQLTSEEELVGEFMTVSSLSKMGAKPNEIKEYINKK